MNYKDLEKMRETLVSNYNAVPRGLYVEGSTRSVDDVDSLFLAHYKSITDYLVKSDLLVNSPEIDFVLLEKDSAPMEDDYT